MSPTPPDGRGSASSPGRSAACTSWSSSFRDGRSLDEREAMRSTAAHQIFSRSPRSSHTARVRTPQKQNGPPGGPGGPFVLLEDELSRGDWKVSLSRAPDSPTQRRAYQDKSIGCAINQLLSGHPAHALLL